MKAYVDAGLTKLGEITQHRSETLTSLVQCTKFQRTRNVLIQSMEAFYCFVLSLYIKSKFTSDQPLSTEGDIHSILRELLSDFALYCMSLTHSAIQSGGDLQKVGCATVISTLTWKPSLKAKAQSASGFSLSQSIFWHISLTPFVIVTGTSATVALSL